MQPFEKGSSRPLDFGHWAAHKLEQLTNYTLRHGEAVALDIAIWRWYNTVFYEIPTNCSMNIVYQVAAITDLDILIKFVKEFQKGWVRGPRTLPDD